MNNPLRNPTSDMDAVIEKIQQFTIETPSWGYGDLIVGSLNPFELFCIFNEIVDARAEGNLNAERIAYMIDQSHNIEPKIEAMVQSVHNIQTAYETDVRPLLSEARTRQGLAPDPIMAFRSSGYADRVARERVAVATASGYPSA